MLTTERLLLRKWCDSDQEPFAALNADPRVMQFMPHTLSREESDRVADRIHAHFGEHRFGLFAAELRATGEFIGFIGLAVPGFKAKFTPCIEIWLEVIRRTLGQGTGHRGRARSSSLRLQCAEGQ
jgi:ribosomal-protein-alanine N-acetyltransferase